MNTHWCSLQGECVYQFLLFFCVCEPRSWATAKIMLTDFSNISIMIISISICWVKKKKKKASTTNSNQLMWQCHDNTATDLRSVTSTQEVGLDLACRGTEGGKGDTKTNYRKSHYSGPNQWSCAGGEPTDSGPMCWLRWVWGGCEGEGQTGGTLAGGTSQMEGDECCQLSRCVCSMVENTEPQVWSFWPDLIIPSEVILWGRLFSVAAVTCLTLTLCFTSCCFVLLLSFFHCVLLALPFYFSKWHRCVIVDKICNRKREGHTSLQDK